MASARERELKTALEDMVRHFRGLVDSVGLSSLSAADYEESRDCLRRAGHTLSLDVPIRAPRMIG